MSGVGTDTPWEHLNQRAAPFPTACSPAPLRPQHPVVGSASPSDPPAQHHAEPRQPSAGAGLGDVHGYSARPQAGRLQSPGRTGQGHVASPCPPFGHGLPRQPSEWAPSQALGSPPSPCPGRCALPPHWHTSPPSLCPAPYTTPSLILTWTRRAQAPAVPRGQWLQAASAVLNCHRENKAELQFCSTSRGPHDPAVAAASVTAHPSHLPEMLKLRGSRQRWKPLPGALWPPRNVLSVATGQQGWRWVTRVAKAGRVPHIASPRGGRDRAWLVHTEMLIET